jgi:diguanylate cyclase (GGDEF)-like protein/PAS domain S-box-containing protein
MPHTHPRLLNSQPARNAGFARLKGWPSGRRQTRRGVDARAILESLDGAVIGRGSDDRIGSWNSGAERSYGYSAREAIGQSFDVIVPRMMRGRERAAANGSLLAGLTDSYQTVRLCKDGVATEVSVRISPIRNAAGEIVGVSTIEHEGSANGNGAGPAQGLETYLHSAFEDAPIGIALVSVDPGSEGRFLRVNRALCELTGYSSEELETTAVGALLHPEDAATDHAAMSRLGGGEIDDFQLEQRLLHAERHAVWVMVSASLVRGTGGEPLYCIRQLQDIEERKRYEGELGYLVEHDPLTGLLNRRGFVRELTHHMAYARRYGGGGAVLLLDLDDFKYVNDALGHSVGDEVISDLARIVRDRLRETDVFGRLGGDEFAVLLPEVNRSEAQSVAESLLAAVGVGCGVSLPEGRRVTVSIGVSDFQANPEMTADDVLVDADDAMYAAKESGKDRITVASAATHERMKFRVTWAQRVRYAVEQDRFELFCQPIIDLSNDDTSQWELLLRMPGHAGELILPAQFLYTAERSGLILTIDRWVAGEAMSLIAKQRDAGREVRLEINLSGRSVGNPELLSLIERGLEQTAIDPASLIFEVTETAAIANMDRARGFATKLRALGCCFALDDFGAGFGSFYYLKHIPFDYVKIDGEFIRNLPASTTDQLILDSIVQMSKGLGTHTIAEFVGDGETVQVLKEHGVDYAQGFYLGRPQPVSDALPC